MTYAPRTYQVGPIEKAVHWMRKNTLGCVLDLSMSSGKATIAAFVAHEIKEISGGKKVLVLCPNATLECRNLCKD